MRALPPGPFDAVIVGGGVMGGAVALTLAEGGMKVALIERRGMGTGASGVNAGTLSMQIKRAMLVPYALKGRERWEAASARLGHDVHYRQTGGLTLAFTEAEAAELTTRMTERRAAGVPLEFVSPARAREIEPGLSDRIVLASFCALDGYANSAETGRAWRAAMVRAGVALVEGVPVTATAREGGLWSAVTPAGAVSGKRLVLAAGAWLAPLLRPLGLDLPIGVGINMVSVTERAPRLFKRVIGHATGLLTLKQSDNGTVLIGGGWQGRGEPANGQVDVIPENLSGNLRLASYAVPRLVETRIVRTWLGLEAKLPDFMPLAGPVPGQEDAFVIGCVRGGYTIGPYLGELLGQLILGREPEMPLFYPVRYNAAAGATPDAAAAAASA